MHGGDWYRFPRVGRDLAQLFLVGTQTHEIGQRHLRVCQAPTHRKQLRQVPANFGKSLRVATIHGPRAYRCHQVVLLVSGVRSKMNLLRAPLRTPRPYLQRRAEVPVGVIKWCCLCLAFVLEQASPEQLRPFVGDRDDVPKQVRKVGLF